MQHRIIYNRFTGSWVFSALMIITMTVMADSYTTQQFPQYSQQMNTDQSNRRQTNPWLLPEKQEQRPSYQQFPQYQGQQTQDNRTDNENQSFRFVTPEILESLKQQQTQNQLMPGNQYNRWNMPRQSSRGYYGNSSYGTGSSNPLYDVPATSPWSNPWGSGPDVLYRGQSFPLVPNEAIGGLSPINIPPYGGDSYFGDPNNVEKLKEYDVFDPFSLIQNENLQ